MRLSGNIKSRIKRLARTVGLLDLVNHIEYLYGNRITIDSLAFYREFIAPGALCFDIGSHYGMKAELFRKLDARVIAVEPNPHCCAHLRRKFGASTESVTIVESGCGPNNGASELHIFELNPQLSTVLETHPHAVQEKGEAVSLHPISIITLDEMISQYGCPDFCKIDAEGFEVSILEGLSHPIAALEMEFNHETLSATTSCLEHLSAIGDYSMNYRIESRFHFESSVWLNPSSLLRKLESLPASCAGDVVYRLAKNS